jgi:hypothetical protein
MTKQLTTMIAVLALAGSVSAQTKKSEAQNLTGTWNMGLQGGHVIPVALVLKQDGSTLTGTLSMPTQRVGQTVDVPLNGEVTNGALTLWGTVENAKEPTTIEIKGTLNDEGMLEGTVTMGGAEAGHARDMPYTAERLRERK